MIDKGQYTNAQLTIKERKMFLLVQIAEKKHKICGDKYGHIAVRQSSSIKSEE
ncbi:MAG: hypothetical protein QXK57_01660 [Conexivisphaerales archaeon]